MFKVRVIPCLDVKDGRVVKGVNFVDLRDAGDPVEAAIAYDAAGADELCFLDITATHENRGIISDRRFDGIAGVTQIDEVDALDHSAVLDVEAGDDADFKHGSGRDFGIADQLERRRCIQPPVV